MKLFLLFGVSVSLASQLRAEDSANIRPAGEVVLHFERRIEVPEIKRLNEEGVLELFPGDTVHLEFQLYRRVFGKSQGGGSC